MTDDLHKRDDLVERLRNTPNWMREGFQDWKDNTMVYDRAPFEAADEITALRARLEAVEKERDEGLRFELVRFENGQFDLRGGPVPAIAEYFAQMFQAGEGTYFNHLEIEFDHPQAGPMVLSAQRRDGQTPNQQKRSAEVRAEKAEAALEDANASVIAFCAPVAVQYARGMGLPEGHLHPTHYDILEKAGARMDSFTRAAQEGEG